MCTLVALFRTVPNMPLVVAANRDELYARRTGGPRVLRDEPRVVGGVDLEKGGTWLGVSPRGLFVGLTNQRGAGGPGADPSRRSRGEIVVEALARGDVAGVDAYLRSLDATEYNAFNVLYGDSMRLHVAYGRQSSRAVLIEELAPGVHVLANDVLGAPAYPKVERAEALAAKIATLPWPDVETALAGVLPDHEKPDLAHVADPSPFPPEIARELQAVCVHTPAYGTRSASIVAIDDGRVVAYRYADGPSCTTPFVDVTALVTPPA